MKNALRLFMVVQICCFCSPCTQKLFAQQLKISGIVRDAQQNPVPGVNVLVAETTNGTSTDADGKFTLLVASAIGKLVFSSIGYQRQELEMNGNANFDVHLIESAAVLNEAVVVGYGTQKKAPGYAIPELYEDWTVENRYHENKF